MLLMHWGQAAPAARPALSPADQSLVVQVQCLWQQVQKFFSDRLVEVRPVVAQFSALDEQLGALRSALDFFVSNPFIPSNPLDPLDPVQQIIDRMAALREEQQQLAPQIKRGIDALALASRASAIQQRIIDVLKVDAPRGILDAQSLLDFVGIAIFGPGPISDERRIEINASLVAIAQDFASLQDDAQSAGFAVSRVPCATPAPRSGAATAAIVIGVGLGLALAVVGVRYLWLRSGEAAGTRRRARPRPAYAGLRGRAMLR